MENLKSYTDTINQIINEMVVDNFPKEHPSSTNSYQNLVNYEKRCLESYKISLKYPGYIPVILNWTDPDIKIKKYKFLVPRELECARLMGSIRSQLVLASYKAIFLYVDNIMIDNMKTIGELYDSYLLRHKILIQGDRYFYIILATENTFG